MRVLITGCGGMLGEAVYSELTAGPFSDYTVYATDIDLNEPWLSYLDVRSLGEVEKFERMVNPQVIVHLAALTDLEYCELHPTRTYDTNFMGTLNMVQVARKYKTPLIYISSAGVFDGKKVDYCESDIPNPLNAYAKSKYAGELAALSYSESTIIRAGWMMGGGPQKDKKFVNKIIKQIRHGAKELFVVRDKYGTPTYTYDLAKVIRHLIEVKARGLFHGACDGSGTRVEVAKEIVSILGKEKEIEINVVDSNHFKKEYFVTRPTSEILVSNTISPATPWQECLKDYLNRFEWKI